MHDTARKTGAEFFRIYGKQSGGTVLDVGSLDINGTLKPFVPQTMGYLGVDLSPGPNVDKVLDNPHNFPFACEEFDIVVSTSCFEHDEFFWLTFMEMCRVVKSGGFIYINAPVQGPVHRHPVDCWRFYPDAGIALARWAKYNHEPVDLIESFISAPAQEGWSDFVAVFSKQSYVLPNILLSSRLGLT